MDDKVYGHKKILREVQEAFAEQKGGKIGVIIGVDWDHTVEDVKKDLKTLRVRGYKHTDLYVWAKLTENQVKKLRPNHRSSRSGMTERYNPWPKNRQRR
jgi:DNA integrity scanning protein DisA with diadenylate cyclase activity